jgi:hypothetical protein
MPHIEDWAKDHPAPTSYNQALESLPAGARWSASFGNPGEERYSEIYRHPDGRRWKISKVAALGNGLASWQIERIEP